MSERTFEPLDFYERLSLLKRVDHSEFMRRTDQATRNRLAYYEAACVRDQKQREERTKDEQTHTDERRVA
jgi:hypothetical protein